MCVCVSMSAVCHETESGVRREMAVGVGLGCNGAVQRTGVSEWSE